MKALSSQTVVPVSEPPKPAKEVLYTVLNVCDNFISANSIKRHISDVKNLRLGQDLLISINDRVILPFHEGFIFTKLHKNKVLAKISEFTVHNSWC